MGCALPGGRDRQQHRAHHRESRRLSGQRRRAHGEPLLLVRSQRDRDRGTARSSAAKARSTSPAASNRSPACSRSSTSTCSRTRGLEEHKPELYWPMLQTAEVVAKRYSIPREPQDRYGVRSQQRAECRAGGRALQGRDRADHACGWPASTRTPTRSSTRQVTVAADEGLRPGTTYEALRRSSRRRRAA